MIDFAQCRSLLYVPAHVPRFIEKAATCGADAVVLDLEDSVPAERKTAARAALASAAPALAARGVPVVVRINHDAQANADIEAAKIDGVSALMLPKVDTAEQVAAIAGRMSGDMKLLAQVESVRALPHLDAIATAPRVAALNLGADDFCVSAHATPSIESLVLPTQLLLFAARRAGIVPLGFAGSVSDYSDLDSFRKLIRHARGLGFRGAPCIHPSQVAILNEEFGPDPGEVAEARAILEAYERGMAEGRGAVAYRGRMIDAPVAERARAVLRQAG